VARVDTRGIAQRLRERELSSDQRAGRFARAKARRLQRAYLSRNWRIFTVVGLAMLSPLLTVPLLPNGFSRGLFVGVLVTAVIALLSFWVVQVTGTAPVMMGDQGEQWTAQELRHLHKRGWRVINDVALKKWNTDHVIVGPGGVYAIESKWSAKPWRVTPPDDYVAAACRQADSNAHTMTLWLKRLSLGTVQPVLVLWGSDARDLPAAQQLVKGDRSVAVVSGPHARTWLDGLPTDRLSIEQISQTWTVIDEHCRRRDAHDADDVAVPPSFSELGMRAVLAVLAASASFLLAATWLGTKPSAWLWLPQLALLVLPAVAVHRLDERADHLVWGWLAGVAVTSLLLVWVIAQWLVQRL
jgi:hypothetical protein